MSNASVSHFAPPGFSRYGDLWRRYLPVTIRSFDGEDPAPTVPPTVPPAGGTDDPAPAVPVPDLNHPLVVAALKARGEQTTRGFDGVVASQTALKAENEARLLKYGSAEDLDTRLERLTALEAASATSEGKTPAEYTAAVEEAAVAKQDAWLKTQTAIQKKRDDEFEALKAKNAELETAEHRSFVAAEIYLASVPEDQRLFRTGAEAFLIDQLAPYVTQHKVEGLPRPQSQIKVGELMIPGATTPNMSLRELLPLLRQPPPANGEKGPSPIPLELSFCFPDVGNGSDTKTPGSDPIPGGTWDKMSESARTAFIDKHGFAAAQVKIDAVEVATT